MRKKTITITTILIVLVVSTGCLNGAESEAELEGNNGEKVVDVEIEESDGDIVKVQMESGTTCYVYENYNGGGISCIAR